MSFVNVFLDGNAIFEPCFALGADAWKRNIVTRVLVVLRTEAEVFSLSVTNPNERPMLPFDWLIHSGLTGDELKK